MSQATESSSDNRSVYRLRWVGYGMLVFALLDTLHTLIPPAFTNSAWELQTLGALVERSVIPLLGMALVFFGESYDRLRLEKIPLKLLSWLCVLLTVLFVLMVPLGVLNTVRIANQSATQVNTQVEQRLAQFTQLESKLKQSSPEDLQKLATQLKSLGIQLDPQKPEDLKKQILGRIVSGRSQIQAQAQATLATQKLGLYKNSLKWNLGALIAATLFFIFWRTTDWARR